MRLHHSDHHILAPAGAPHTFAKHGVGLAHTWRIAEKQLEHRGSLGRVDFCQPFLWGLGHRGYFPRPGRNCRIGLVESTSTPRTIVRVKAKWPQQLLRYVACLVMVEGAVQV